MKSNKSAIAFFSFIMILAMVSSIVAVHALRGKASKEEERDIQLLGNIFSSVSFLLASSFQFVIDFIYFIFNAIIGSFFFFVSSITRTTTTAPTTTSPPTALSTTLSTMAITTTASSTPEMPATTPMSPNPSTMSTTLVPASTTAAATTAASTQSSSTSSMPATTTSTAAAATTTTTAAASSTTSSTSTTTMSTPPPGPPKRVFLTSTTHNGNLGGIEGADAICNERASAGGLNGTFAAWISNATDSPSTRFVNTFSPYIRTDNETFATSLQSLLDNGPVLALSVSEQGDPITSFPLVWTNTMNRMGTRVGSDDCDDWTNSGNAASGGVGTLINLASWSAASAPPCASVGRLYCFQQ